jgi:hypothetical protein
VNIVVQVVLSYPTMKFWIMPKTAEQKAEQVEQG